MIKTAGATTAAIRAKSLRCLIRVSAHGMNEPSRELSLTDDQVHIKLEADRRIRLG
jgi:hypothetical protein